MLENDGAEIMKNLYLKQKLVRFFQENPLPVMTFGLIVAYVGFILTIGLILPHKAQSQSLTANGANAGSVLDSPQTNINPRAATASYADVVERVAPSVVTIRADIKNKNVGQNSPSPFDNPVLREFFGGQLPPMKQTPQIEHALGSGVIVGTDGVILTNNHVVAGAEKIKTELPDRRTFDAKIIGTDAASDLAVLKIEAGDLPAIPFGDSDRVRVGDVVLAIGNPLGLRQTVTSGIISAKGRRTGLSDGSFEDFLQTDAPINQGNSGGALVDLNGELVGINSQILSPSGGSIGIGFSIPSNMAKSVMRQLLRDGAVRRGMLGIVIQNLTSDLANSLKIKDARGVLVNSVKPGSPAEKAGIKQGDVIVAFNGGNIADDNELRNRVAASAPGSAVGLTIVRQGQEQFLQATVGELAAEKAPALSNNIENER
jgi:serine protease Do